jgi:uncharacterized membrane protein
MNKSIIINAALSGGIAVAFGIIGVCFIRFWRRSRIKLFLLFAIAFFLLTIERVVLVLVSPTNEFAPYIYAIRLTAFLTIIVAIIDQNRRRRP